MKALVLIALLLVSQLANALGPEEIEFVGKLGNNKRMTLRYTEDPNMDNGKIYVGKSKQLSYCVYDNDRISCGERNNGRPEIIYGKGNKESKQFLVARNLYKKFFPKMKIGKWNPKGVYADEFFVCSLGCSASVPELFILVTHGD